MHLANAIICNNLEAPLSNGNYSFWTPLITVVKTKLPFHYLSLFEAVREQETSNNVCKNICQLLVKENRNVSFSPLSRFYTIPP